MTGVGYLGARLTGIWNRRHIGRDTGTRTRSGQAAGQCTGIRKQRAPRQYPLSPMCRGSWKNAMPSIVAINDTMTVEQRISSECPRPTGQSSGSGIIVRQTDTELLIATNNHVVDGASGLKGYIC